MNVGFVVFNHLHYYVQESIQKHLPGSLFVLGPAPWLCPDRWGEERERLFEELQGFLLRRGRPFIVDPGDDCSTLEDFDLIVCPYITPAIHLHKSTKVRILYGLAKERYNYGSVNSAFDLVLVTGHRPFSMVRPYARTSIVGYPRFDRWFSGGVSPSEIPCVAQSLDPGKVTVLYLPTYGSLSSLDTFGESVKRLRERHNVIVKLHHGTAWMEPERRRMFEEDVIMVSDETDLLPLLSCADVVISDNSGAIFDALLADKPLVLLDVPLFAEGLVVSSEDSLERAERELGVRVGEPADLERGVEIALARPDGCRSVRDRLLPELFAFQDGRAGERAAEEISLLAAGKVSRGTRRGQLVNSTSSELRVLFVARPDLLERPGGDTTQILSTRKALADLGVNVELCLSLRPRADGYDLAHAFGLQVKPDRELNQISFLHEQDVPLVYSTVYWDLTETMWAGKAIKEIYGACPEPSRRCQALSALKELSWRSHDPSVRSSYHPFPHLEEQQERILSMVDYLLPNACAEVQKLDLVLGLRGKPFTVVPNAVDASVFENAKPDMFLERYGIRDFILAAGRIEVRKNQLLLIEALRDLDLPLVLAGNWYDQEYYRLCRENAGPRTLFVGHLPRPMLASAMAAARVHVLPSWYESPGLANLEAAMADCSIVAGNRAAEFEYFGEYAYYCDPSSVPSIRAAVLKAYANYERDRPRREALAGIIKTRYTWERAARATLDAYRRLLGQRDEWEREMARVGRLAAPFPVSGRKKVAFLMFPEWSEGSGTWRRLVADYISAFRLDDEVTLVLRADPAEGHTAREAVVMIMEVVAMMGRHPEDIPDVVILDDYIPGDQRAGLYAAVDAWVPCGEGSERLHRREASLCGCRIVEEPGRRAFLETYRRLLHGSACPS